MIRNKSFFLFFLVLSALPLCAYGADQSMVAVPVEGSGTEAPLDVYDPLEPVNRGIFWFNDKFDRYLLEPVSQGYDYITPDIVQEGVHNFFSNLEYPIELVSDVIELDFSQAANDTGRFVLNTTVGLAGIMDIGSTAGLMKNKGDIGTALGRDGVGDGFYLVLPFFGPSNIRDAAGTLASAFVSPTAIMAYSGVDSDVTWWVSVGTKSLEVVNTRVRLDDAIKTSRESSLDQYLFLQSAYYQYRNGIINRKGRSQDSGEKGKVADDNSAKKLLDDEYEKSDTPQSAATPAPAPSAGNGKNKSGKWVNSDSF